MEQTINNSGLGLIKRWLCGLPPFLGKQQYLTFGSEFHSISLEDKRTKAFKTMDDEERFQLKGMMKSLSSCKLFTSNKPGATIEKLHKKDNVYGIWGMHGTLDLNKKKRRIRTIIDIKTTSETTEAGFIKKSIKLGYPRQGCVYEQIADEDDGCDTEIFFIGVSKKNLGTKAKPFFPHFIFDLNNYEQEKSYAENEAKFLLNFYRENGLPIEKQTQKTS